ncbi:hypothetical protein P8452_26686 [Trifolium repens]|nr:hypothetical protein P8452_26686 [Trifolium repens]
MEAVLKKMFSMKIVKSGGMHFQKLLHPSKLIYAVSDIDLHEVIADGLCYSFRVLRATAFDFSNKFGGCNSLQMGSRTMPRFVQVATLIG